MKMKKQPKINLKKVKRGKLADQLLPPSYRPLSAWNYFWRSVLYCIPVVGLVFMIAHAIGGKNRNARSYARSFILSVLFVIAAFVAAYMLGYLQLNL